MYNHLSNQPVFKVEHFSQEDTEITDETKDTNEEDDSTEQTEGQTEEKKKGKKLEPIPILEPLPEASIEGHAFNFVNELKLSDFKMVLSKNNIASEFQGGVLFCGGGMVALR